MKRLLLTFVLLWPVAGLADLVAGLEAYIRGDYATALHEFQPLAEVGVASAQHGLSMMYCAGHGVAKDAAEAVKWHRLAAEQGDSGAQDSLGDRYATGKCVQADLVQAYAWYTLAAAQGNKWSSKSESRMRTQMTSAQIAEAQKLSRELCAKIPNCAK